MVTESKKIKHMNSRYRSALEEYGRFLQDMEPQGGGLTKSGEEMQAEEANGETEEVAQEEESEISTNFGCLLPDAWDHVDLDSFQQSMMASSKSTDNAAPLGPVKHYYAFAGSDPKEFAEGHTKLYFLKQMSLGGKRRSSQSYDDRLARRAYLTSRNLSSALYDVTPSSAAKRVRIDDIVGLESQEKGKEEKASSLSNDVSPPAALQQEVDTPKAEPCNSPQKLTA